MKCFTDFEKAMKSLVEEQKKLLAKESSEEIEQELVTVNAKIEELWQEFKEWDDQTTKEFQERIKKYQRERMNINLKNKIFRR